MTEQKNSFLRDGLSTDEAEKLLITFGKNQLTPEKEKNILRQIVKTLSEPMFILLLAAAVVYFVLGEPRDGAVMLVFVIGIISIDVIQEWKTDKTLKALKDLSAPHVDVIRDGRQQTVNSVELVPGDIMLISEGLKIPADGRILKCSDFCVDESSLTGEAENVWKTETDDTGNRQKDTWRQDFCYAGTLVIHGSAVVRVDKTGSMTEFGKIGQNISEAPDMPTPLQKQTASLVRLCACIAAVLCIIVACVTWFNIMDHPFKSHLTESILSGITLAMAMIPEEFPVILTVFLSLGAWRLAKKNSLVRRLPAVETLGAVSVLCVDKTGTITQNRMTVTDTWAADGDEKMLNIIMGMACETDTYDPMEKAMLSYCDNLGVSREELFSGKLLREYPFTNEEKMMGHVWKKGNTVTVAAKGSPEKIMKLCDLSDAERNMIEKKAAEMAKNGRRVIAVGRASLPRTEDIPNELSECRLHICGLAGLTDPPREFIEEDIRKCTSSGIRIVMITGDNGMTASAVAGQIGIPGCDKVVTGDELNKMSDSELKEKVRDINVFSRVVPEHKMRIVRMLKENGEVVAMTGDGVNDAPALKYADIGVAMGKRGSEVSREAADLILLDDNFSTIVETIRDGRRIYDNIKKAVGYVFSIHIPIAFASLLAPVLNVPTASLLLLPLHVVLLELVIDPTCSIVLERQPAERDIMKRPPRDPGEKIADAHTLIKSLFQGVAVFAASFGTYFSVLEMDPQANTLIARSMGLTVIFFCNLLLVQVNSSNTDFAYRSVKRLAKDKVMWAINLGTLFGLAIILYTPAARFLKLAPLSGPQMCTVILVSLAAVLWYELVKLINIRKHRHQHE